MKEQILEPLLRQMRINRVLPHIENIRKKNNCHLLDVGCGWEAKFLYEIAPYIITEDENTGSVCGIDFKAPYINKNNFTTISARIDKKLPFQDKKFDIVTLLAVLEHMDHPLEIVKEIHRILKPGGILLGTVPSKAAKPVLEFLSYRLNIVNPDEIRDHKEYYTKTSLEILFTQASFITFEHKYFQFGMNNFFVAKKGE